MAAKEASSPAKASAECPLKDACTALLRHLKKKTEAAAASNLLGEDADPETIVVNFVLSKLPSSVRHKPVQVKLPHSLLDPTRGVSLCLFVKDPAADLEAVLASNPVPGFDRVMGYKKIRTEFKEYKRRRALLAEHDAFFCDDRILPMLPKLVGSTFSRARQTPVPVRITRVATDAKTPAAKAAAGRALQAALEPVRDSTWIRSMGQGTTFSVRCGFPYFTPAQLVDNAAAIIARTAEVVPGGWRNVQAVFIKSTNSVPLQVHASLGALGTSETATAVAAAALGAAAAAAAAKTPEGDDAQRAARRRAARAPLASRDGKAPADAPAKRGRKPAADAILAAAADAAAEAPKAAAGTKAAVRDLRSALGGGKVRSRAKSPAASKKAGKGRGKGRK
ncbi:hypothetical protein FNF28_07671 [Cafeteria roenbergensis]|uniref:Ribosomal protein L1 n=1 Tax=Cafeteria roenbergensis TaxID=33653 RepID=A0A5A8C3N0_CAFRO|nr:hypothetical protein FNF28_07671 [Cafeteria roenbergensis]